MDKTGLNANVTIISIVVTISSTVISIILFVGGWNGVVNWTWVFLTVALLGDISLIYIRRRKFQRIVNAIKPKPKLGITIHDITCYVSTEFRQEDENPRMQSNHIALDIVCTVRINNKSRVLATQILGEMKLSVKQGENSFSCQSKRTVHTYKLAKEGPLRQERIVFERKYFLPKDFNYYPNASYRLEYIYQCREHPNKELIITYKSTFAKVDWVGQKYIPEKRANGSFTPAHWVPDEEVLKLIRGLGFIDPS